MWKLSGSRVWRHLGVVVIGIALIGTATCGRNSSGGSSPTAPSTPLATSTFLSYANAQGPLFGSAQSRTFTPDNATFSARLDCYLNALRIEVTADDRWTLDLAAPLGSKLAVGTYERAERYPFQRGGFPGLGFAGAGRGCGTLTGRFVVREAVFVAPGIVERFYATFEQQCGGSVPSTITGEVALVGATIVRRFSC